MSSKSESVAESERTAEDSRFVMQVDSVFGLPRSIKAVKMVYGQFREARPAGPTSDLGTRQTRSDQGTKDKKRAIFDSKELVQEVEQSARARVLFEL